MFTQKELLYMIECLNFHYSENDDKKNEILDINSDVLIKLHKELIK